MFVSSNSFQHCPLYAGVFCWEARAVALATGTADVPRRLGIPGEDLDFVTHRPPIHHQAVCKIGMWNPRLSSVQGPLVG